MVSSTNVMVVSNVNLPVVKSGVLIAVFMACMVAGQTFAENVDWAKGTIEVTVSAHGSRQAPSPRLARLSSESRARLKARAQFKKAIKKLPLSKKRSWKKLSKTQKARLESILNNPITKRVGHHSDGSITLQLVLPLEKLRTLWDGFTEPQSVFNADGLFVDARHLKAKPVLDVTIQAGNVTLSGTTLWIDEKTTPTKPPPDAIKARSKKSQGFTLPEALENSMKKWKNENRVITIFY